MLYTKSCGFSGKKTITKVKTIQLHRIHCTINGSFSGNLEKLKFNCFFFALKKSNKSNQLFVMAHSGNHLQNNIGLENHGDNAALLPHLESFEKMMKLPVVEAAWHQGQDVYGKVKGKFAFLFYFSLLISFKLSFRQFISIKKIFNDNGIFKSSSSKC